METQLNKSEKISLVFDVRMKSSMKTLRKDEILKIDWINSFFSVTLLFCRLAGSTKRVIALKFCLHSVDELVILLNTVVTWGGGGGRKLKKIDPQTLLSPSDGNLEKVPNTKSIYCEIVLEGRSKCNALMKTFSATSTNYIFYIRFPVSKPIKINLKICFSYMYFIAKKPDFFEDKFPFEGVFNSFFNSASRYFADQSKSYGRGKSNHFG